MKPKNLVDYLEKDREPVKLIQGLVPEGLATEVRKVLIKKKITWNELLTASLLRFLDEVKDHQH